jgi:hypothetical protein
MKNILPRLVAAFLVLSFVLQATAPTIAYASAYTNTLKNCGNGVYVPKDQPCPAANDFLFFACALAVMAAALAAAAAVAWIPFVGGPMALAAFGAVFTGGILLCPHSSPPPPPAPNLTVSAVSIASGSTVKGNDVTFKATVRDSGSTSAIPFSSIFQYRWGTSGAWTTFGTTSTPIINAGSSATITSPTFNLAQSGNLSIRACADSLNEIPESNESDNCSAAIVLSIAPSVTLVPQPITQTGTPLPGRTQTFSSSIKNNGTSASPSGTNARFCVDDPSCGNSGGSITGLLGALISVTPLAAGATSGIFSRTWVATLGSHTAYFCVVGGTCSTRNFTINNTTDCTFDGATWSTGTTRGFYNTVAVSSNESCSTGSDTNGVPYRRNLLCTNGSISGDTTGTYIYASCSAVAQNEVTITANGNVGSTSVRKGTNAVIAWDGGNATTCTISGTDGTTASGVTGNRTVAINQKTVYTATCTLGTGVKNATVTVNLLPMQVEI